jgi:SAM-dependent methyltransferase
MSEPDHVRTTRAAYDASADGYLGFAGTELSDAIEDVVDLALVRAFAELVVATAQDGSVQARSSGAARLVADLGCGPGRMAASLARLGLDTVGIDVVGFDLSPAMVAAARAAHPTLRFDEAALTAVPLADGALAGAVCWYSIIHTPPDRLDEIWAELARLITPGGWLMLGFQSGAGEAVHRSEVAGRPVSLTNHRHDPEHVVTTLVAAGFALHSCTVREPVHAHETTPQAIVIARRSPEFDLGGVPHRTARR